MRKHFFSALLIAAASTNAIAASAVLDRAKLDQLNHLARRREHDHRSVPGWFRRPVERALRAHRRLCAGRARRRRRCERRARSAAQHARRADRTKRERRCARQPRVRSRRRECFRRRHDVVGDVCRHAERSGRTGAARSSDGVDVSRRCRSANSRWRRRPAERPRAAERARRSRCGTGAGHVARRDRRGRHRQRIHVGALQQQHERRGELDRRSVHHDERDVRARSQRHAAARNDDPAHDDRSVFGRTTRRPTAPISTNSERTGRRTTASTPRSFAMLLSGKSSSGNSASGIAWIDAYCETQSQGGSYSVNQVFTNPQSM